MTTTKNEHLEIALDAIEPHPQNVRRNAVADEELVDSVRTHGVLQDLLVIAEGDRYKLLAGHRRLDALRKAGRDTAPCVVRHDLVTEAQQIEVMLIENGRREDLTPVEEAAGYEQLELFGYKPKDIAKATGRSLGTVKERLRLRGLSETARGSLHDGQLTLHDAETLLEFSDDPEALAELEPAIGTNDFRWKAQDLRHRRVRAAEQQREVDELDALGATVLEARPEAWEPYQGPVPLNWLPGAHNAADHDSDCLGYVRPDSPSAMVLKVCLAPSRHRQDTPTTSDSEPVDEQDSAYAERMAKMDAQREAARAEVEAQRAAEDVRRAWIAEHLTDTLASFTGPAAGRLAAFAQAFVPLLITDAYLGEEFVGLQPFATAHDQEIEQGDWRAARDFADAHADRLQGAPARDSISDLALVLACVFGRLLEPLGDEDAEQARRQLYTWDWLRAAGYQLPTPDEQRVAALVAIVEGDDADEEVAS